MQNGQGCFGVPRLNPRTRVVLNVANGVGSQSSNKVRRFTNYSVNNGPNTVLAGQNLNFGPFSIFDDAVNGTLVTFNVSGMFSITYSDASNAAANYGIILNPANTTTAPYNQTPLSNLLSTATSSASGASASMCVFAPFLAGDTIRPMTDTSGASAVNTPSMCISFIAPI